MQHIISIYTNEIRYQYIHVFNQKCIGMFQQTTTSTSERGNSIFSGFTIVFKDNGNPPNSSKVDAMYEIK